MPLFRRTRAGAGLPGLLGFRVSLAPLSLALAPYAGGGLRRPIAPAICWQRPQTALPAEAADQC